MDRALSEAECLPDLVMHWRLFSAQQWRSAGSQASGELQTPGWRVGPVPDTKQSRIAENTTVHCKMQMWVLGSEATDSSRMVPAGDEKLHYRLGGSFFFFFSHRE